MNTSGIIRKIDDLGRIVLPKELRKYLNINTGDDFQISLEDEKIILEKYSYIKSNQNEIIKIISSFIKITNVNFRLIVNNRIVTTGEKIESKIIDIINDRKIFIDEDIKNYELISCNYENGKLIIYPIVLNSDLYGAIVVVHNHDTKTVLEYLKIIYDIIKNKYI